MAARMFSQDQLEQLRSFPDIGKDDVIRYLRDPDEDDWEEDIL